MSDNDLLWEAVLDRLHTPVCTAGEALTRMDIYTVDLVNDPVFGGVVIGCNAYGEPVCQPLDEYLRRRSS